MRVFPDTLADNETDEERRLLMQGSAVLSWDVHELELNLAICANQASFAADFSKDPSLADVLDGCSTTSALLMLEFCVLSSCVPNLESKPSSTCSQSARSLLVSCIAFMMAGKDEIIAGS
jgi:hypothetical protein